MKVAYQYRLKPTTSQSAQMENWLGMLCAQYNYRLAQRFNWYNETRCQIDACPLVCSIVPVEEIFRDIAVNRIGNHGYVKWKALQKGDLPQTKIERPWYKDIHSQVLQDCVLRVEKTFERFVFGDKNGKPSGRPRFKSHSRYRSFTYPQIKQDCLKDNRITLPKIGDFKIVLHRPLLDGFKIKTATIIHKADGWYVILSLQDDTVPVLSPNIDFTKVVGIDFGLKDFLVTSDDDVVPIPQFQRKSEKRRKLLNKSLSRKKRKGTKRRHSSGKRLSKHYQKVARQRKDFHYNTAKRLIDKYDVIAHEDRRSCRRRPPAGSAAENAGKTTVAVNPNGTTQICSDCGTRVPKTLTDRVHVCTCGLKICRDLNAAINIRKLAEGHPVSKARGDLSDSRSMKREAESVKPTPSPSAALGCH